MSEHTRPNPLCIRYAYRDLQSDGTFITPTRRTTADIAETAARMQTAALRQDTDTRDELGDRDLYLGNDSNAHVDDRFAYVRVEIHEVTPEEMDEIGEARERLE